MARKSPKRGKFNLIALVVFIGIVIFSLYHERSSSTERPVSEPFVPVIAVHDGDTVSLLIQKKQEKVRLIGIDAPELGQIPWGEEAKKHLENLLRSSEWKVRPEFDVEKRDQHGRTLAYLKTADGRFINSLMVRNGYALLYTFPPNVRYVQELRQAQEEAQSKRLGIWSRHGMAENPRDYRKTHPRP